MEETKWKVAANNNFVFKTKRHHRKRRYTAAQRQLRDLMDLGSMLNALRGFRTTDNRQQTVFRPVTSGSNQIIPQLTAKEGKGKEGLQFYACARGLGLHHHVYDKYHICWSAHRRKSPFQFALWARLCLAYLLRTRCKRSLNHLLYCLICSPSTQEGHINLQRRLLHFLCRVVHKSCWGVIWFLLIWMAITESYLPLMSSCLDGLNCTALIFLLAWQMRREESRAVPLKLSFYSSWLQKRDGERVWV